MHYAKSLVGLLVTYLTGLSRDFAASSWRRHASRTYAPVVRTSAKFPVSPRMSSTRIKPFNLRARIVVADEAKTIATVSSIGASNARDHVARTPRNERRVQWRCLTEKTLNARSRELQLTRKHRGRSPVCPCSAEYAASSPVSRYVT